MTRSALDGGPAIPAPRSPLSPELPPEPPPRHIGPVERIEETVTMAFFVAMFLTLLLGVFWRYVLNEPLTWTVSFGAIAFLWVVMIGSGLPNRDDSHLAFDLVYEKMPPAGQLASRITGNLLIVVCFAMAIPGCLDYLSDVHEDKVTGLPLHLDAAFSCVLVFLVATVLHRGKLLLDDLQLLRQRRRERG